MKDVPLLDELRATRQRLAQELELDAEQYAAMLRGVAQASAGKYVTEPLLPPVSSPKDAVFNGAS
jgi:hypothetical protein